MKHNVSSCPEAHLVYSCSGIWPCETQQLFYFLPSLFISESAVQYELARFPSDVGGVVRNGLPNGFYTLAQPLLLSKSGNCCSWKFFRLVQTGRWEKVVSRKDIVMTWVDEPITVPSGLFLLRTPETVFHRLQVMMWRCKMSENIPN